MLQSTEDKNPSTEAEALTAVTFGAFDQDNWPAPSVVKSCPAVPLDVGKFNV